MRRMRTVAATVISAVTVALGLVGSAPATAAVAYPAPAPLPPVTAATLDDRYTATRAAVIDALAVARAESDQWRAARLESLAGRDLLEFDGRGNGRVVEVIGDLARADRIALVVPGSHITLDTFDRNRGPGGGARALAEQLSIADPEARVAVVAWLGYDTPQGASLAGITDGLARTGADALRSTVEDVGRVNDGASISLLCHSYGSVVCAYAAPDLQIADLVFYGSPGVSVGSVGELGTPARVWAGRASGDWIRYVPAVRVAGLGFGADPVAAGFGATVFPTGDGGHGDYHLHDGVALESPTLIALGEMEVDSG